MVIPLQKYNGENTDNNKVIIDYEKKTVDFTPINPKGHVYRWFEFLELNLTVAILITVPGLFLIIVKGMYHFGTPDEAGLFLIFLMYGIVIFISPFALTLPYFIPHWRKQYFPKYNAGISIFIGGKEHKIIRVINPECIRNNVFILPVFNNVMLKYEATEDFGRYLKKIEVLNVFKNKGDDWQAHFIFNKKPRLGQMQLQYI